MCTIVKVNASGKHCLRLSRITCTNSLRSLFFRSFIHYAACHSRDRIFDLLYSIFADRFVPALFLSLLADDRLSDSSLSFRSTTRLVPNGSYMDIPA